MFSYWIKTITNDKLRITLVVYPNEKDAKNANESSKAVRGVKVVKNESYFI